MSGLPPGARPLSHDDRKKDDNDKGKSDKETEDSEKEEASEVGSLFSDSPPEPVNDPFLKTEGDVTTLVWPFEKKQVELPKGYSWKVLKNRHDEWSLECTSDPTKHPSRTVARALQSKRVTAWSPPSGDGKDNEEIVEDKGKNSGLPGAKGEAIESDSAAEPENAKKKRKRETQTEDNAKDLEKDQTKADSDEKTEHQKKMEAKTTDPNIDTAATDKIKGKDKSTERKDKPEASASTETSGKQSDKEKKEKPSKAILVDEP